VLHKWVFYSLALFPFYGWAQTSSPNNDLTAIDQQIQALRDRIHQGELREMKEEVEGQEYMIADWDKYAEEVQQIRKQELENDQLRLQIKKLDERKQQLLRQQQTEKTH
jgi:hypothetical protein